MWMPRRCLSSDFAYLTYLIKSTRTTNLLNSGVLPMSLHRHLRPPWGSSSTIMPDVAICDSNCPSFLPESQTLLQDECAACVQNVDGDHFRGGILPQDEFW
jgi:hypothetical protein